MLQAFASRLRERIRYGAEVVRIEQRPELLEIVLREGGDVQNRITADRIVVILKREKQAECRWEIVIPTKVLRITAL